MADEGEVDGGSGEVDLCVEAGREYLSHVSSRRARRQYETSRRDSARCLHSFWNGAHCWLEKGRDLDGTVHTILRHVRRRIVVIIGSGGLESPRLIDSYMASTSIYVNTEFFEHHLRLVVCRLRLVSWVLFNAVSLCLIDSYMAATSAYVN